MPDTRSEFLIHWTGWDIEEGYREKEEGKREMYVERLRRTLLGDPNHWSPADDDTPAKSRSFLAGLWMPYEKQNLVGRGGVRLDRVSRPVTCFSEIRLSQVAGHTTRYGRLGFGFDRRFVMQRRGVPVMYVTGSPTQDVVVGNLAMGVEYLGALRKMLDIGRDDTQPRAGFRPEQALMSLSAAHGLTCQQADDLCQLGLWLRAFPSMAANADGQRDDSRPESVARVSDLLQFIAAFLKHMSESADRDDMTYLNEHEWRIVHTGEAQEDGLLVPTQLYRLNHPDQVPATKIPFTPCDLKVLIFPDDQTRHDAMNDGRIRGWFETGGMCRLPIMATVDECDQF